MPIETPGLRSPGGLLDFSPRGRGRVAAWTLLGTLGCMIVALSIDVTFNAGTYQSPASRTRGILINIGVPLILAAPLLFFLTSKMRELAIVQHELARLATIDSLTALYNRGAFTALVGRWLEMARHEADSDAGALLVIDVDNFKAINDSLGHDGGDEALVAIARSMAAMMRGGDLLGRIGGEEFGAFLPGATPAEAEAIAERIRRGIADLQFAFNGRPLPLSVSVGGAAFRWPAEFTELFRVADQQLYAAKRQGRNRVLLATLDQRSEPIPLAG